MARTNYAAVSLILDTSLTEEQVGAFIDDASQWVDSHLLGSCSALSTAELTTIEKYLACHLVTLRDPRLSSQTIDEVSEKYQVTEYIKMAAAMDPCGIVSKMLMGQKGRVRFRAGAGFDDKLSLPSNN